MIAEAVEHSRELSLSVGILEGTTALTSAMLKKFSFISLCYVLFAIYFFLLFNFFSVPSPLYL